MGDAVLALLILERDKLITERNAAMARFDKEIGEFEAAIAKVKGYQHHQETLEPLYDDQHPDYIKASIEE